MLRWYGYLGIALLLFANLNFILVIQPFASWYIPIVWYGYILFVDSIVYRLRKRSLISTYAKEFAFIALLSVPFWLLFEGYNTVAVNWIYINYTWQVHIIDFTTIMPAVLETFTLVMALGILSDLKIRFPFVKQKQNGKAKKRQMIPLPITAVLAVIGVLAVLVPLLMPSLGFPFVWIGMFLLLDPINYLLGRESVVVWCSNGMGNRMLQLFLSGIIMGFFWEFWNYLAYPKWIYTFPLAIAMPKLFEMPIVGYLGYLPFALDVFLFYELFRPIIFNGKNPLLGL